jgi:hypothetical protein
MTSPLIVERSQLVDISIQIGYTANTINIPDQPMLRNKRIMGMKVYIQGDFPVSPITGNATPTLGQLQNAFFIAYTADPQKEAETDTGEYIYKMPMIGLHNTDTDGGTPFQYDMMRFDELKFEWEKCQLYFPTPLANDTAFSYVIEVFYTSRVARTHKLLGKKMNGITDGSLVDMLITKIMEMEAKLKMLMSKK